MNIIAKIAFGFPIIILAGCDMTIAVSGMLGSDEALSGSLTHYSDGGTIELFGGPRTHCVGNYTYRRGGNMTTEGLGTLVCDDRRTGPFRFIMKGMKHGTGTGMLADLPYRFSF